MFLPNCCITDPAFEWDSSRNTVTSERRIVGDD